MAFCRFCGKQLAEGEVCTCQQSQQAQQPDFQKAAPQAPQQNWQQAPQQNWQQAPQQNWQQAPQQNWQQAPQQNWQGAPQQVQPGAGVDFNKIAGHATGAFNNLLSLLKAPVTYASQYIRNGNLIQAIILIVLQALFSAFFALTVVGKINGVMGLAGMKIQGWGPFFLTLLYSAMFSVLIGCVYFAVVKIMGSDLNFKQALCAASVRSVVLAPLSLLSCLLFLLNIPTGVTAFYMIGLILGFTFFMLSCQAIQTEKKNKLMYVAVAAFCIFTVLAVLISLKILIKGYIPKDLLGNFGSMLDFLM